MLWRARSQFAYQMEDKSLQKMSNLKVGRWDNIEPTLGQRLVFAGGPYLNNLLFTNHPFHPIHCALFFTNLLELHNMILCIMYILFLCNVMSTM